jgi:hypothetical protein
LSKRDRREHQQYYGKNPSHQIIYFQQNAPGMIPT